MSAEPTPLAGIADSHEASLAIDQSRIPPPRFVRWSVCAVAEPPAVAAKENDVGARPTEGAAAVSAVAEIGESAKVPPVVHCAGSAVSVVELAVSAGPLGGVALPSMNESVTPPAGTSTAIQYVAPAVTVVAGTATLLHESAGGLVIVPWVRSAPGCPDESAYKPTIAEVAVG